MEKKYIIGGLAIVGAIALFAYLKPKTASRNSEGFFGANGRRTKGISSSAKQLQCRRPNGSYYLMPSGYNDCTYGSDKEVGYV
jgi:hypothetical protein